MKKVFLPGACWLDWCPTFIKLYFRYAYNDLNMPTSYIKGDKSTCWCQFSHELGLLYALYLMNK